MKKNMTALVLCALLAAPLAGCSFVSAPVGEGSYLFDVRESVGRGYATDAEFKRLGYGACEQFEKVGVDAIMVAASVEYLHDHDTLSKVFNIARAAGQNLCPEFEEDVLKYVTGE